MLLDRKYTVPFLVLVVLILTLWTIKLTTDQQNVVYTTPKIRPHSINTSAENIIRETWNTPHETPIAESERKTQKTKQKEEQSETKKKQDTKKAKSPTKKEKQSSTNIKQNTIEKLSKAQQAIGRKVETKLTKYLKLDFSHYKQNTERGKLNYILHTYRGRLGNHMSQTAALLGIALRNGMIPALNNKPCKNIPNHPKQGCFMRDAVSSTNGTIVRVKESNILKEKSHSKCDVRFSNLSATYPKQDLHINGYLFCPAYYEEYHEIVRRELTWNSDIRRDAKKFFQDLAGTWGDELLKMATIGIHVRREEGFGDGSPMEYYRNAISYFRNTIRNKDLIFIVSGNNKTWNEENIVPLDKNVVSMRNSPEVDMAIFNACDHMISSRGTFSYWAGYLGGGITTYYMHPKTRDKQKTANFYPKNFVGVIPGEDVVFKRNSSKASKEKI